MAAGPCYPALHRFLFAQASTELTFVEFQGCFPSKYKNSTALKRLYEEMRRDRQQVRAEVEANLKREFERESSALDGELQETIEKLKMTEKDIKKEYKRLLEEAADLQEELHKFEERLGQIADQDRPFKKPKLSALEEVSRELKVCSTSTWT